MGDGLPARIQHLVIEGRVQGVGYRWFARQRARRRGLSGWVCNRPDGTVELHVSGQDSVVRDYYFELLQGPPGAAVAAIRELSEAHAGEPTVELPFPFQIQRQPPG